LLRKIDFRFFDLQREDIDKLVQRIVQIRIVYLAVHRPQAVGEHRRQARDELGLGCDHQIEVLPVYRH